MQIDGISAIAVVLIAAFAIDRSVTGLLFLFSFIKPWNRLFPYSNDAQESKERKTIERKQKLIYYIIAGILGGFVLAFFGEIRIFHALGFTEINQILDSIVTGLILVAGADRMANILKLMPEAPEIGRSDSSPIEITGKLILEDDQGRTLTSRVSS